MERWLTSDPVELERQVAAPDWSWGAGWDLTWGWDGWRGPDGLRWDWEPPAPEPSAGWDGERD